jgi:hypothetical protein
MVDRITVTVDDDHLSHVDDLARRLRAAGMQVDHVLRPVGVIIGSIGRGQRDSIRQVPGVAAVDGETSIHIAPPEADVQ